MFFSRTRFIVLCLNLFLHSLLIAPLWAQGEGLNKIALESGSAWFLETKYQSHVQLYISFPVGAMYEDQDELGITYLLAETLKHNKGWILPDIHSDLKIPTGDWIQLGGHAEWDRFIIQIALPKSLLNGLPEIVEALSNSPKLDESAFEDVKRARIAEMKQALDPVVQEQFSIFFERAVLPTRWQTPLFGTTESLEAIGLRQLLAWASSLWHREGVEMILTGALTRNEGEEVLTNIYDILPKEQSPLKERDAEEISLRLAGFVERIDSPNDPKAVLFAIPTEGRNSEDYPELLIVLQTMGCDRDGWLYVQLINMNQDAIESARVCWYHTQHEGMLVGRVTLKDTQYGQSVYRSILAIFDHINNNRKLSPYWYALGRTLLTAEWGSMALHDSFDYTYLIRYLSSVPAAWQPETLDALEKKLQADGLSSITANAFLNKTMQVLILQ